MLLACPPHPNLPPPGGKEHKRDIHFEKSPKSVSPLPATASAEGRQFNGAPFPATASAEGAQFNVLPSLRERELQAPAGHIAVDTVGRSHYNAPACPGYWLTLALVAEYEPASAAHVSRPILRTSSAAAPLLSGPFRGEATTPQSRLISSPAGGASPVSARIP